MFINFIVNLFTRFRLTYTVFLILNTIFVFSNQPSAQEENGVHIEEAEQRLEGSLIKNSRVRRAPPGRPGRLSNSQRKKMQEDLTKASSLQTSGAEARDASPEGRLSTTATGKRSSPTAASASPPKQAKVEQQPVISPFGNLPIVYGPTPTQSNDRYRLLRGIQAGYASPFTFTNPRETQKSFRHFRLQWRTNGDSNAGMEHILKRHTREYHDGSFKKKQSMFPQGTTHIEIKNMIQEVAESQNSQTRLNAELGVQFLQIEGRAKNNTPLVVGYKKNAGLNKPLDIVQAYPLGSQYEVQILPSPTRRRRGAGSASRIRAATRSIVKNLNLSKLIKDYFRSQRHKPSTLGMENFVDPSPLIKQGLSSMNTPSQETNGLGPIVTRDDIKRSLGTLRPLSLSFSNAESSMDSITLKWETITDRSFQLPFSYTKQYEFYKNNELVTQGDSTTFTDQPDENKWTEYKMVFTDSEGNRKGSPSLKVGAKMIPNLKATTTSESKILLEWNSIKIENEKITYKVVRNGEIIATLDTNSFLDNEVEPNQDYVYRILIFVHAEGHYVIYSQPLTIYADSLEELNSFALYTYFLSEEVPDLEDLSEHPEDHYTPISEKELSHAIVQNSIVTWDDEQVEMLNGMIDVVANGHSLVSPSCFDNVRMLWDYLLTMTQRYLQTGQAKVYFPDQPIIVSLTRQEQGTVEFQIDDQLVTIDEKQCLTAILHAAEQFFTLLNEVSIGKYSALLEQIKEMEDQMLTQERLLTEQPISQVLARRTSVNEVLVSWAPSSTRGIKSYEILLCGDTLAILPADAREYIHKIQEDLFGKHTYQVIAYDLNDREYEPYSIEIEIAISYLQVEKITPDVFELNWAFLGEEANSIEFYNVYRDAAHLIQAPKDVTTFSDTTLLVPGVYTYKVEPLDENGCALEMEPAIREIIVMKETYLRAYVNPSNTVSLSWEFLSEDEARIQTYRISCDNAFIRYVFKGQLKRFTHTTELEPGEHTYTVEALGSSGNIIETKQIVVKIND